MKQIFLFAGQGSQKAGMGKDLYEEYGAFRKVIDEAGLSFDLRHMMQEAPVETLSRTEYTQPCMAAFAAGVLAVLKEHGIQADGACGLSLGEYGALYAAGVFGLDTYLKLAEYRGRVMAEAAAGCRCAMSAVLGMEAPVIEAACADSLSAGYVTVANYNCPGQSVICGEASAVEEAERRLKEQGCRKLMRLNVSGPFHTAYMKPAGEKLEPYFQKLAWNKPEIPVVLNVTGDFYKETESLPELLVRQVQSSVRMEASLRTWLDFGADTFVEIGPGTVLSGFLKKTAKAMGKTVQAAAIENASGLAAYLELNASL